MKYYNAMIGFQEVPDEISLCINITNCNIHCEFCHSPHLWQDIGIELTDEELKRLIDSNKGITCVAIMGGNANEIRVYELLKIIHELGLKTCWYSGRNNLYPPMKGVLNYVKFGPYIKNLGGLDSPISNQRFFKIVNGEYEDLTYKFNKNETKN